MPNPLQVGPFSWGYYIRNIQTTDNPEIFLVEIASGKTGKAKVWWTALIYPNPDQIRIHRCDQDEWSILAQVKACHGYRKGQSIVRVYVTDPDAPNQHGYGNRSFECHFWDEAKAVQFMLANAERFYT